jgi:hypothetical protein
MYQRKYDGHCKTNGSKSQKLFEFHPCLEINLHAWGLPIRIFNEWSGSPYNTKNFEAFEKCAQQN